MHPGFVLVPAGTFVLTLLLSAALHILHPATPWDTWYGLALTGWTGWLISGWRARWAWWGSLGLLAVFVSVTVAHWAMGAEDCGCFPGVRVPPWATAALDAVLLVGLWRAGPLGEGRRWRVGVAALVVVLMSVLAALALVAADRARQAPWGAPLDQGRWRVIAVRDDCEHCAAALTWLIPVANAAPTAWAFVSYSGSGAWLHQQGLAATVPVVERSDPGQKTPFGLELRDGAVVGTFIVPSVPLEEF